MNDDSLTECCDELAARIHEYLERVSEAYEKNPQQMSSGVLNLFDLWRILDIAACKASPLLLAHHPVFTPKLLDSLQCSHKSDMARVRLIQNHLKSRISGASLPDIFARCKSTESFSFRTMESSTSMRALGLEITEESDKNRSRTEAEWYHKLDEWEHLSAILEKNEICSCPYARNGRCSNQDMECSTVCIRCQALNDRDNLRIRVHEDFLPIQSSVRSAAIVFELQLPRYLAAYRAATWKIVRDLIHPTWAANDKLTSPEVLLGDHLKLKSYISSEPVDRSLTLGSTKKIFQKTHYHSMTVTYASYEKVIHNFAADFRLYDHEHKIWVEEFDRNALTIEHVCGVHIPKTLHDVLPTATHPPITVEGPSSYQLLANRLQCPQDASPHEFAALQKLLFGSSQRWINILVELGSANLNFSSMETIKMVISLARRIGPCPLSEPLLGESGVVFKQQSFRDQLKRQIENRMHAIKSNWRETHCMCLLIALSEYFARFGCWRPGIDLIKSARRILMSWIRRLRQDLSSEDDAKSVDTLARYAFMAAMLCRMTFSLETSTLEDEDLRIYCEASIALHQNTAANFDNQSDIKAMMINDTKVVCDIREVVEHSIRRHPRALESAIMQSWPFSQGYRFCAWDSPADDWVSARLGIKGSAFESFHIVHFNYAEGFLLMNSEPLAGLPLKFRRNAVVKELFGEVPQTAFASRRPGMSHQLAQLYYENEVHLGLRHIGTADEVVVIQLVAKGNVELEYIPRGVFSKGHVFDLPLKLRDSSCFHFLNYDTKSLEIRRQPYIWKLRPRDWVIDLTTRKCQRGKAPRISRLINQESRLGISIVQSFKDFEEPEGLVIYQPSRFCLSVELSRHELTFFVNKNGRLEESKLRMEFDENQDAGTLYGLLSKIVLRDINNPRKRSVLIPLGKPKYRRLGPHQVVSMSGSVAIALGKFDIDGVLGRLTTPPEPSLIFARAYLHALTSFPLPDPLTSRTGMEEAFHILQSAVAQPWRPFGIIPGHYLAWIAMLSPERVYYPKDERRLQTVRWDVNLSVTAQHDGLKRLVEYLRYQSDCLQVFQKDCGDIRLKEPASALEIRGQQQRALYEPSSLYLEDVASKDKVYHSRDTTGNSKHAQNVISIMNCLFQQPFSLPKRINLEAILNREAVIGGFVEGAVFSSSLGKLVEDNCMLQWGKLVQHCIETDPSQPFHLGFHLSLLVFDKLSDVHLVFAAFARLGDLKLLALPYRNEFTDYDTTAPNVDILTNIIKPMRTKHVPGPSCKRAFIIPSEQRHNNHCDQESRRLADFLVRQWPAEQLNLDGFTVETKLLNEVEAFQAAAKVWEKWQENRKLGQFAAKVRTILDQHTVAPVRHADLVYMPKKEPLRQSKISDREYIASPKRSKSVLPSLARELFLKNLDFIPEQSHFQSPNNMVFKRSIPGRRTWVHLEIFKELEQVLKYFIHSTDPLRKSYGVDLQKSLRALEKADATAASHTVGLKKPLDSITGIQQQMEQAQGAMNSQRDSIVAALARDDDRYQWLRLGNLWPGANTVTLLEQLRSSARVQFGAGMKEALVHFGLAITLRQWLDRVLHEIMKEGEPNKLEGLLNNTGHENWNPINHPDWLLMEIEADILIRSRQVDVARQIISPTARTNSLMQLNMGEGKL